MLKLLRYLAGLALGSAPGILLALSGNVRPGISVAAIGALVGALLAVPGVSAARVVKLFVATMISYNVPFVGGIDDILDVDSPDSTEADSNNSHRIEAEQQQARIDRESRFAGCVIRAAFLTGLVCCGFVASIDTLAVMSGGSGLILPFPYSNDSILAQGIMLTLAGATWTAVIAVSVVSKSCRNILAGIGLFTGFLSGMVGFAASNGRGPNGLTVAVFFTTIAVGVAVVVMAWLSNESS